MSNFKFSIGDEVVVNDKHAFLSGECGIIKYINGQFNCIKVNGIELWFKDDEIELKYSFSKTDIWVALDDVYGNNKYTMNGRFATELKDIETMSGLQVKNKFGSIILYQLLLNRSDEA